MWKRFLIRAQPLFMGIAVVFIVLLLRSQWATLRNHRWQLHSGWLMLSGVLMVASWGMEVSIWQHLLKLVDRLILVDQGKVVADGPRDKVIEALAAGAISVQKG